MSRLNDKCNLKQMSKKGKPLLVEVAEICEVSYGHVRNVHCGQVKSERVTQVIIQLSQRKLRKLCASIRKNAIEDIKLLNQ